MIGISSSLPPGSAVTGIAPRTRVPGAAVTFPIVNEDIKSLRRKEK
jgi:hypothetical protein